MALDVLAIGDIATDTFIRLKDASVTCDSRHEHCLLCMRFGAKIPYESVAVVCGTGNAANAAVACATLGLTVAMASHVGDDDLGRTNIETLRARGIDTSLVVREAGKTSNHSFVLWFEDERTILVKHEEFSYRFIQPHTPPQWIYFSSVGKNSDTYHREIEEYLSAHPSIRLAFQPGTCQLSMGKNALINLYKRANIVFCNKQEAQTILETNEQSMAILLRDMRALGAKIVVITDALEGVSAADETTSFSIPAFMMPKPAVQRTGAGDALASTTMAYLSFDLSLEESLMRGAINAASVAHGIGAQANLLTRDEIEQWYMHRPAHFVANPLTLPRA